MAGFRNNSRRGRINSQVCHFIPATPASRRKSAPVPPEARRRPKESPVASEPLELIDRREQRRAQAEAPARPSSSEHEYRHRIDLLERRLSKLARQLVDQEEELRAERERQVDEGVASVYDSVQGIDPEAENAQAKREMMSQIFGANLKLHEAIASKPRAAQ